MPSFHSLRVNGIRKLTEDCIAITLDLPKELEETFRFRAGQHLGFRLMKDGEEIRRTYSLCTDPGSGILEVAVKRVEGGMFSGYAHTSLKVGDVLEVMPPAGRFGLEPEPGTSRSFVAFAAGSGITPIMSMLKAVLEGEPDSSFTLIYGNSRLDTIIFLEELEALKNKYLDRFALHHVLSRQEHLGPLFSGRIDKERASMLIDRLLDVENTDGFFLCGPYPMIQAVEESLQDRGVDKSRIHHELFAPAGEQSLHSAAVRKDLASRGSISVTLDGHTYNIPIREQGQTILETATASGIALPFACKGGVCCTCRAKLEKGEVDMPVNYALEEEELKQGYILTCQSYPITENLQINYDAA